MKKLFLICAILITILSISAVSAEDNSTDTIEIANDTTEIITEPANPQKEDLNIEMECNEYIVKPDPSDGFRSIRFNDVPEDYRSTVAIYIDDSKVFDGNPYYVEDEIELRSLEVGKHMILAEFKETSKYNPLNLTKEIEVGEGYIKIDSEITSTGGVHIDLRQGASGYLTVNVDGKLFKKVKLDAVSYETTYAYVELGGLKKGTYDVEATYTGNLKRIQKTSKVTINPKVDIYINLPESFIIYDGLPASAYGSPFNTIDIMLSSDAKSKALAYIDGVKYDVTDNMINVSRLNPGNHSITVVYPGDDKYGERNETAQFNIKGAVRLNSEDSYYLDYNATSLSLLLPQDAKGNLTVYVDENPFESVALQNGMASVKLDGLKLGVYKIKANYTGSDYEVMDYSKELKIMPKAIYPKEMNYSADETFKIDAYPGANLTLKVTYDSEKFELNLENGSASFSLKNLKMEGTYDFLHSNEVHLEFVGENYYVYRVYTIKVLPITPKLIGAKDITMYYDGANTYSLTVWGEDGKKVGANQAVKIKIGSKTYTEYTDKNGVIKHKIEETPGKYTITATYHGVKATSKLTVKEVITLKSAKVKKSAKKLEITATLKGKAVLKNKPVTFKFNGKTYRAKTNNKGIAKVTVPKSVLSKLKVGKTVTYQVTYLKDTVKKTAKVQK